MPYEPNITRIAMLIGDTARARMMIALMGGKALTATELATEADITAQTASSHLSKLVDRRLVTVQKQGRHKYFQLSGHDVAELLETLLNVSAKFEHSLVATGPGDPELRKSRICYDHLAGEIGVRLLDALKSNALVTESDNHILLTAVGRELFAERGADLKALEKKRRPLCKNCLDWSERRNHLAGALGQWMLNDILNKGWAKKDPDTRVIRFSDSGLKGLRQAYGLGGDTA